MKARWVLHNPQPELPVIGQCIVASWWPGRFYLVSTIKMDGTSALERLTESIKTLRDFKDVIRGSGGFVTQIFHCDRQGFVREIDFDRPLYFKSYPTLEDAKAGHKAATEQLAAGNLRVLARTASEF